MFSRGKDVRDHADVHTYFSICIIMCQSVREMKLDKSCETGQLWVLQQRCQSANYTNKKHWIHLRGCVLFPPQCHTTWCCSAQCIADLNICANGFIMGLLSSPAFVCAISEILPRVPADLLYPLLTPEDTDFYSVVVLLTVFLIVARNTCLLVLLKLGGCIRLTTKL